MSRREEFEKEMCNEYSWFGETLELAHFHGDDATGYYTGGDYIYHGKSCADALFWAWCGWQASKTKSEAKITALTSQLESVVAENAALKAVESNLVRNIINDLGNTEFQYAKVQTPATDAFLAEVRASAVDDVCLKISNAIVNCYQDEQIGLDAAATICGDFAAQLRKERG